MEKTVKDIMTSNVEVVPPECTVQEAAQLMKEMNIGALPICDGDRLKGIVTDRDICTRIVAEGKDPTYSTVTEAMSEGLVFCFEDDSVEHATRRMENKKVGRILVLNHEKRLCGILSLKNVYEKTGAKLQQVA